MARWFGAAATGTQCRRPAVREVGESSAPAAMAVAPRRGVLRSVQLAIALAAALPVRVQGAYFRLEEGKVRCFEKNVLEHEVLRIQYSMIDKEVLQADPKHRSDCRIFVKDKNDKAVKEHALGEDHKEDVLVVLPQHTGEHSICLECASDEWFGKKRYMRWSLSFEVLGDETSPGQAPNLERLATFGKLKGAQAGIEDVISRVVAISTENAYEKRFEGKFTKTSESVNTDVAAFKILQIMLVAGVTAYQLNNMIKFLRSSSVTCCLPMRGRPP